MLTVTYPLKIFAMSITNLIKITAKTKTSMSANSFELRRHLAGLFMIHSPLFIG